MNTLYEPKICGRPAANAVVVIGRPGCADLGNGPTIRLFFPTGVVRNETPFWRPRRTELPSEVASTADKHHMSQSVEAFVDGTLSQSKYQLPKLLFVYTLCRAECHGIFSMKVYALPAEEHDVCAPREETSDREEAISKWTLARKLWDDHLHPLSAGERLYFIMMIIGTCYGQEGPPSLDVQFFLGEASTALAALKSYLILYPTIVDGTVVLERGAARCSVLFALLHQLDSERLTCKCAENKEGGASGTYALLMMSVELLIAAGAPLLIAAGPAEGTGRHKGEEAEDLTRMRASFHGSQLGAGMDDWAKLCKVVVAKIDAEAAAADSTAATGSATAAETASPSPLSSAMPSHLTKRRLVADDYTTEEEELEERRTMKKPCAPKQALLS